MQIFTLGTHSHAVLCLPVSYKLGQTLTTFNIYIKKNTQVDDMKNRVSGIKFITAFKTKNNPNYHLP